MTETYWQDNTRIVYNKDCRDMSELADNSIQCVVTSPPYWGLRKYSGEQDLIWGDKKCEHDWQLKRKNIEGGHSGGKLTSGIMTPQAAEKRDAGISGIVEMGFCSLCGAWKGQLGLEPTPEMYLEHLVKICREIKRVLRKDGCFFLNIGDSYIAGGSVGRQDKSKYGGKEGLHCLRAGIIRHSVLKQKDLCLIPFRLAIALQEDGWWIRSVIIWSKPNPMPESVKDRPTESHEYILMLTKSAHYYWDQEAVRTPYLPQSIERSKYPVGAFGSAVGSTEIRGAGKLGARKMVRLAQRGYKTKHTGRGGNNPELGNRNFMSIQGEQYHGQSIIERASGSNLRSVWQFATQPYSGAHFSVFPEKLPEICIKAATPEVGCCSKCGQPWVRIIKHHRPDSYNPSEIDKKQHEGTGGLSHNRPLTNIFDTSLTSTIETIGWKPQCSCEADKIPSIVLDPFAGSGTTLLVASKLGRKSIGYELSEEYCRLIVERNRQSVFEVR